MDAPGNNNTAVLVVLADAACHAVLVILPSLHDTSYCQHELHKLLWLDRKTLDDNERAGL